MTSCMPVIPSSSLRLALFVLTYIFITICKNLLTMPMLKKIFEFTFVSANVMFEYTFSMLPIVLPISFIIMSLRRFPFTKAIFHSILPKTLKNFTIIPFEAAFTRSEPIFVSTNIYSINISFQSENF